MNGLIAAAVWGGLGGWLAWRVHLPGGAVVGAMLATALFNFTQPVRAVMPVGLEVVVQIAVGVMIGLSADRALLPMLRTVLPLALMGALGFLAFGFSLAALAVRMGWLDAATALFGFTPGGISVMSLVAAEEGGQAAVVATMHFVRVVTILLAAPLIVRLWLHLRAGG
ncbi:AbrB family transcriptional regulator [Oceanithermus sp.]